MTTYSNEAVLEALRRAQYRQVPWAKRPGVFQYLRTLGLMDIVRQRTVAPAPGFHAPVDIAVLTERGKAEFARLAHDERLLSWTVQRTDDYVVASAEARLSAALDARP
jgi:hypothetical protein